MERRRRRCKTLLYDVKKTREECKFEGETLFLALWGINFKSGYGLVPRQTVE